MVIGIVGCARGPSQTRFVDLVIEQRVMVDGRRLRAQEVFASDETWVAVTISSGEVMKTEVELADDPSLELVGHLECRADADTSPNNALRGAVRAGDGSTVSIDLGFEPGDGWWRREVALGELAGKMAVVEIEAALASGCVVHLRELGLRQRVPVTVQAGNSPSRILVISVDTLRLDAIGAFGGEVDTPALDRFAAESESWRRHYAAASWTKPSHASMLTGYSPDTHRALLVHHAMDPLVPTLADRFRKGGYTTAGLVFDCTWLSPRWGFGKGFESYRVTRWRAARQARSAAEWILAHPDEPFFFFLHTFEPHSDFSLLPYEAPGVNRPSIAERFGVENFGCRDDLCASTFVTALSQGTIARDPEDVEILRSTYDDGVSYLDRSLGSLFEALRQQGIWDDLLVVVTSDHGEEFSEHGGFNHGTVYEEILKVPLLIKWPGGERGGVVHEEPTASVDLAPTLLDFAGLPVDTLPGFVLGARPATSPIVAGVLDRAVIDGQIKGIFDQHKKIRAIYNLDTDPGEQENLVEGEDELANRLEALLRLNQKAGVALHQRIGSKRGDRSVELSQRERERLKAFGYLED